MTEHVVCVLSGSQPCSPRHGVLSSPLPLFFTWVRRMPKPGLFPKGQPCHLQPWPRRSHSCRGLQSPNHDGEGVY